MTINLSNVKAFLAKLTPSRAVALAAGVLAVLAAFRLSISPAEQAAVIAFVGAAVFVISKHPTTEAIVGLVGAALAVAAAFGLPLSQAQTESVVGLTALIAALVGGKAAVGVVQARKEAKAAPDPAPPVA